MLCGCLRSSTQASSLYKKIIAGNYSEPRHLSRDARDSSGGSSTPTRASSSPSRRSNRTRGRSPTAAPPAPRGGRERDAARRDREPRVLGARLVVARAARAPRLAAATTAEELAEGRHTAATASYFLLRLGDPRRAKGAGGHSAHGRAHRSRRRAAEPPPAPRAVLSARDGNTNAPRAVAAAAPKPAATPTRAAARGTRVGHAASPRLAARRRGGTQRRRCTRRRRQPSTRLSRWARRTPPRAPPPRTAQAFGWRVHAARRRRTVGSGAAARGATPAPPRGRAAARRRPTAAAVGARAVSPGVGPRRRPRPGHAAPRAAPPAAPRHGADFRRGRYAPVSARAHSTRLYAR